MTATLSPTTCHGCHQPLEPLAQIRTYHSGCDPRGRVDSLAEHLAALISILDTVLTPGTCIDLGDAKRTVGFARAALEFRPVQMKGREG
jgi:hypothetical protein